MRDTSHNDMDNRQRKLNGREYRWAFRRREDKGYTVLVFDHPATKAEARARILKVLDVPRLPRGTHVCKAQAIHAYL